MRVLNGWATLHDGSQVAVTAEGAGPAVLLPVDPTPAEGEAAETLRAWGTDPALGRSLIDGLSDGYRVIAVDYLGHRMAVPAPDTLTPETIAHDLLAVADAAGAARFAYYGYSWLALSGLQLALRTDRLTALVMGGFPPLGGPYAEMLAVTAATHDLAVAAARAADAGATRPESDSSSPVEVAAPSTATNERTDGRGAGSGSTDSSGGGGADDVDWSTVEVTMTEDQTRQFVTLYVALRGFDDRAVQDRLPMPRLAFAGSEDTIDYEERWGGVQVSMADALVRHRAELEALGWQVVLLDGLDHTGAMQPPAVLPLVHPWLDRVFAG